MRGLTGASATQSAARNTASIADASAFAEVILTANAAVTFSGTIAVTITYAGGPATYVGTFQDPAGKLTSSAPQTSTGSVYTATSPSGTYTLAAGGSIAFDFATSAPVLVFGSPALSFITTGAAAAQTDTVSYPGYTGAYTATSENAAVATASISGGTVTVTPAGPGTTSIDVTGATTGKISITVTTTPVTVN